MSIRIANATCSGRSPIQNSPVFGWGVLPETGVVEPSQLRHLVLHLEKGLELTPPINSCSIALWQAPAERECSLVEDKMHVFCLLSVKIAPTVSGQRLWGPYYFNVEAGAEGGNMRHGEIVMARVLCGEKQLRELTQAKGRQDGDDVGIVGEVEV